MANLMTPKPLHPELPVFFNVGGVVGAPPAQNAREDVLLVQFVFNLIANSPLARTPPEMLAVCKTVRVTGNIDQATINAIRAHQQYWADRGRPGKVVDGRVSPARGGYSYGGGMWTIARLNDSIQHRNLDVWPRIDKIPDCPGELKQMVKREVIGV